MYIQLSTNLGWRALLKDIWTCKNRTKKWHVRLTQPVFYPVIPTANYGHRAQRM
jgi:hypothetical protein